MNDESKSPSISSQTESANPEAKRELLARKISIWFVATAIVLSIVSLISSSTNSSDSLSFDSASTSGLDNNSNAASDTSWVPSGFKLWANDSNIAWEWKATANCGDYGCVNAYFISRDGCPNGLYAAVNWVDGSGTVLSYANATLPSLSPLQKANLKFEDIEGNSKSAQMSEINCR